MDDILKDEDEGVEPDLVDPKKAKILGDDDEEVDDFDPEDLGIEPDEEL